MAIESVDMNRALNSASYAQQAIKSGKITTEERAQLATKWGADKIQLWESIDGTEYKIDDVSYDSAKAAGANTAAESVGYDGGKTGAGFVDLGLSAAGAVGGRLGAGLIQKGAVNLFGEGGAIQKGFGNKAKISDVATVIMASAIVAKYLAQKPNEEQHKALMEIQQSELPQGNAALEEAQINLADATEKVTELSEEAEAKNEDANDKIEEQKALFDFYRTEYMALKEKAQSGEKLTSDEKALMEKLTPLMQEIGDGIGTIQEDTQGEIEDIYGSIEDSQEIYDNSAETIGEVEGMTEYVEGFDENTRASCYAEAAAQGVNALSAIVAAGRLWIKSGLTFGSTAIYAAMGTAAAIASKRFATMQLDMANQIDNEIDDRRNVQDFVGETQGVFEEELDNYAGNIEVVEDLELEIPEDIEIPESTTVPTEGGQGGDPLAAGAAGIKPEDDNQGGSPLGGPAPAPTNKPEENDEDKDPNKKKKDNE